MTIRTRFEQASDKNQIYTVNERAFGQPDEADLVDRLRAAGRVVLSLVAEKEDKIVGHILFTAAEIVGDDHTHPAIALAPVAVAPEHQRKGLGGRLIEQGLAELTRGGYHRVIVLGHADYYPRFGFLRADQYGILCPFDVPPEVFMALALKPDRLENCAGTMRWAPEFGL